MTQAGFVAEASTTIAASVQAVWAAITTPDTIKRFMFGTQVTSDWRPGSAIVWRGVYQGKAYEDHGTILALEPPHLLRYSHYSPLSGAPDTPENHHTVTYRLSDEHGATRVMLTQDQNANEQEQAHSSAQWTQMLAQLKAWVEGQGRGQA